MDHANRVSSELLVIHDQSSTEGLPLRNQLLVLIDKKTNVIAIVNRCAIRKFQFSAEAFSLAQCKELLNKLHSHSWMVYHRNEETFIAVSLENLTHFKQNTTNIVLEFNDKHRFMLEDGICDPDEFVRPLILGFVGELHYQRHHPALVVTPNLKELIVTLKTSSVLSCQIESLNPQEDPISATFLLNPPVLAPVAPPPALPPAPPPTPLVAVVVEPIAAEPAPAPAPLPLKPSALHVLAPPPRGTQKQAAPHSDEQTLETVFAVGEAFAHEIGNHKMKETLKALLEKLKSLPTQPLQLSSTVAFATKILEVSEDAQLTTGRSTQKIVDAENRLDELFRSTQESFLKAIRKKGNNNPAIQPSMAALRKRRVTVNEILNALAPLTKAHAMCLATIASIKNMIDAILGREEDHPRPTPVELSAKRSKKPD